MISSMPWNLIVAFTLFLGFGAEQQRHARDFRGRSQVFLLVLNLSVLLATLAAFGLLIYYGIQTSWYWPLILFLFGLTIGPVIFGFVARSMEVLGTPIISMLAFVG